MFIIAFLTVVGNESITTQMVSVTKLEFVSGIKIMAFIPNIQQQDGFGPFEYQTSSLFSFPAFIDSSVSLAIRSKLYLIGNCNASSSQRKFFVCVIYATSF